MAHPSAALAKTSLKGCKRFEGQTFIITGGAQGIGFGIAQRLCAEGAAHGAIFDVNEEACKKAVAALAGMGFKASYQVCDVTKWESVKAATDAVHAETGRIDVVVQAAGITGKTAIKTHEVDPDNFDLVMAINVKGVFHQCKAVLPYMLEKNYGE